MTQINDKGDGRKCECKLTKFIDLFLGRFMSEMSTTEQQQKNWSSISTAVVVSIESQFFAINTMAILKDLPM